MDAFELLNKEATLLIKKHANKTNEELLETIFNNRDKLFTFLSNDNEHSINMLDDKYNSVNNYYNIITIANLEGASYELALTYEKSKHAYIEKNMLMVFNKINKYVNLSTDIYLELYQECILNFQKAFNMYDFDNIKGAQFSSFAFMYIDFAVKNTLKANTVIKLNDRVRNVIKHIEDLQNEFGDMSAYELSHRLPQFNEKEINEAIMYKNNPIMSMEQSIDNTKNTNNKTLQDVIADEDIISLDIQSNRDLLEKKIKGILNSKSFSDRDRDIIRMRFGIGLLDTYTLEEIGQQFGLTRERVRQIETRAMQVLKVKLKREELYS